MSYPAKIDDRDVLVTEHKTLAPEWLLAWPLLGPACLLGVLLGGGTERRAMGRKEYDAWRSEANMNTYGIVHPTFDEAKRGHRARCLMDTYATPNNPSIWR